MFGKNLLCVFYSFGYDLLEICGLCHTKILTRKLSLLGLLSNRSLPRYIWTINETQHSSAVALREHFSPEQSNKVRLHQTNKAFERYFRIGANDIRQIYKEASNGNTGKSAETKINKLKKNK